jgi:hypothetical protein
MDAFRGLGDMPSRMGFTSSTGGRVDTLPYAEGQLIATLADDWRRIRLEPQLLTWGSRVQLGASVGNFHVCALSAGRLALRLRYFDPVGTTGGINISRTNITGLVLSTEAPIVPLEAPTHLPTGGVSTVAAARLLVFTPVAAQFLNPAGFKLLSAAVGGVGALQSFHGEWLPRILLPGEFLVFQTDQVNIPLNFSIAWEQLPSLLDVLTSRAEPVEPQIGP